MSRPSLENLLQTLINTPEAEKGALLYSLVKALREACNMFNQANSLEDKDCAREIRNILDNILSGSLHLQEEEWEEEFAESGSFEENDIAIGEETFTSSGSQVVLNVDDDSPASQLKKKLAAWNKSVAPWMRLASSDIHNQHDVLSLVQSVSSLRWNMSSGSNEALEDVPKLDSLWKHLHSILGEAGYRVSPPKFGNTNAVGQIIYTCRSRITSEQTELIMPNIELRGEVICSPVTLVTLPIDVDFPDFHPNYQLPVHWRGIFGELELLMAHVEVQMNGYCAIEGINKNKVESLSETRSNVLGEIKRRAEVLQASINRGEESLYRLATDYWRVEECFWSIFHDDKRPSGCSYFDRLRNRLQGWRTTLRRNVKFHIRDFSCGSDTIASVNKYVGNMILRPEKGKAPGLVVRELRPAVLVKEQAATRVLKGRVIAT